MALAVWANERTLRARVRGAIVLSEAWLFGSYVCGGFGADSDVDLILVTPTNEPFQVRS